MSKRYGPVENEFGRWQLHYLNSWRGVTKNLCYDGVDSEPHDHATAGEAASCAIALSRISEEFKPKKLEEPREYVAPVKEPVEEPVEETCETTLGGIVLPDEATDEDEPVNVDETSTEDLEDDVAVEAEIEDDNESRDEE